MREEVDSKGRNFACVHCGGNIEVLYRKYNSSVLKLTECSNCLKTADKYIEYDGVIILIDLILFNREPYRHILLNSEFKNHWKLAVIILLLKTYSLWETTSKPRASLTEHNFYLTAVITLAGSSAFFVIVAAFTAMNEFITNKKPPDRNFLVMIWKAVTLSSFGQFFLLPALIWTDLQRNVHITVVLAYVIISQMQALSVVSSTSRQILVILLLVSTMVELSVLHHTRRYFYT